MARRIALQVACAVLAVAAAPAYAQWGDFLKDKLQQEAKDKAGRAVHEAGNEAYGDAKKAVKGEQPPAPAKAPPQGSAADAKAVPGAKPAPAADEVAAGEVYGNRFDFVPGDRVLLFDDFAETGVGDYPARWTVKDGGGNAAEVVGYQGRKWFKSTASAGGINDASMHWLRYEPKGDLPRKFTIELDADMGGPFSLVFDKQHAWGGREIRFAHDHVATQHANAPIQPLGRVVRRISVSVNGTYVKVYVGGARVLQDPDALERPITRIGLRFDQLLGRGGVEDPANLEHQMFTGFRLAEGGKDLAQALSAEGRIVVHGVYFDTGSDVLRPESGGALRGVLELLQGDASLRFRVEGHTDDQGGDKVNGPLSERRAAAVKAWFVRQGIEPGRLEAKGFGATRPIDSNATQEGRANNRRVEFVRIPATS